MGTPRLQPATWGTSTRFCATSGLGTGCAVGEVCAPLPNDPSCFLESGSQVCPAGFAGQVLYTGLSDTRTCACSCQAVGGDCSTVSISASQLSDCSGASRGFVTAGFCTQAAVTFVSYVVGGAPTNPTSCDVSNDQTGAVTPTGLETLCCR
jgi:hypothetical protein